jgi:hypothetical protein
VFGEVAYTLNQYKNSFNHLVIAWNAPIYEITLW